MKKSMISVAIAIFSIIGPSTVFAEKAPQKVVDMANSTLADFGGNPVIVKAIQEQNSKNVSLDQIKEMDDKWKATPGIDGFMQAILDSECSKELSKLLNAESFYAEIFAMDNQGANVCMTDKTSDYWQGDEDKFKNSFADGAGAVFVDDVEYDESSQAYLVQVSVPVKDNGKVIGAITFGINIDKIE